MSTDSQHERIYNRGRGARHIGMGILLLVLSIPIIKFKTFGNYPLDTPVAYGIGGLVIIYGGFRVWRGFMDIREARNEKMRRDTEDIGRD